MASKAKKSSAVRDPADHTPSIDLKCPTCEAVPGEDCTEGRAGNMRLVPLHKARTVAGNKLKALNGLLSDAMFGRRK